MDNDKRGCGDVGTMEIDDDEVEELGGWRGDTAAEAEDSNEKYFLRLQHTSIVTRFNQITNGARILGPVWSHKSPDLKCKRCT
jgi:hypothetical protein